mgnify:CR=1 FL=1
MATNNLQIKISAKNKTARAFRAVKAGLGGIARAAFSMKTAVGAAAGIAGIGFLVKRSMNLTDELAKSSRAIGVSVEALQRLRHAANLGGMESKQLDKAVQKLAINIAEVATGTGEAKDAFEQYGIAATNQDGTLRNVGSVMGQVADVMQGMTNQTARASLAYDLFGARGAKMVNVLKDGRAGLHAAMLEADELGLVMNASLVIGVEKANDAITRLTSYLANVFHRVVATLAPVIQDVTDALRTWFELKIDKAGGPGELAKEVARSVLGAAKSIMGTTTAMVNSVIGGINQLRLAFRALMSFLPESMGGLPTLMDLLERKAKVIDDIGRRNRLREKRSGAVPAVSDTLQADLDAINKTIERREYLQDNFQHIELVKPGSGMAAIDRLLADLNKVNTTLPSTANTVDAGLAKAVAEKAANEKAAIDKALMDTKLRHAYGYYTQMVELEQKSIQDQAAANEERLRQTYSLYGAYRTLGEKTQNIWENTADAIKDAYDSMADSVTSTLTDLIVDGGNWRDAMKGIINDVYREFVRKQISAPLVNAGSNLMGDIFETILGTRAMGGPVVGGGNSYLVGESGPELFTPGQNGHITPNNQLGSQPVNITYNIKSWDSRDTMATLQKSAPQIVGIIQEAFNKRGQRGFA